MEIQQSNGLGEKMRKVVQGCFCWKMKIDAKISKGRASRGRAVLCLQDPSYREHWKNCSPAVCPQVCIRICIIHILVSVFALLFVSASFYHQSRCQSGQAVLFLVHNDLHPNNGGRLLRELQEEMLHWVHSNKVKSHGNHPHFGLNLSTSTMVISAWRRQSRSVTTLWNDYVLRQPMGRNLPKYWICYHYYFFEINRGIDNEINNGTTLCSASLWRSLL